MIKTIQKAMYIIISIVLLPISVPFLLITRLKLDDLDEYVDLVIRKWYPIISKQLGVESNISIGNIKTNGIIGAYSIYKLPFSNCGKVIINDSGEYINLCPDRLMEVSGGSKILIKLHTVSILAHEMRHCYQVINNSYVLPTTGNMDIFGTSDYYEEEYEKDAYKFSKSFTYKNLYSILTTKIELTHNYEANTSSAWELLKINSIFL